MLESYVKAKIKPIIQVKGDQIEKINLSNHQSLKS